MRRRWGIRGGVPDVTPSLSPSPPALLQSADTPALSQLGTCHSSAGRRAEESSAITDVRGRPLAQRPALRLAEACLTDAQCLSVRSTAKQRSAPVRTPRRPPRTLSSLRAWFFMQDGGYDLTCSRTTSARQRTDSNRERAARGALRNASALLYGDNQRRHYPLSGQRKGHDTQTTARIDIRA